MSFTDWLQNGHQTSRRYSTSVSDSISGHHACEIGTSLLCRLRLNLRPPEQEEPRPPYLLEKTQSRHTSEESFFTTLNSQATLKWLMHNNLTCVLNFKVIHKCFPNVLPAPNAVAAAIVTETQDDNKNWHVITAQLANNKRHFLSWLSSLNGYY